MSDEFDFEPIRGLPAMLPEGERMLWQGAPDWWVLARDAFHVRKVAVYFGLLAAWQTGSAMLAGEGIAAGALSALWTAALAAVALGILTLLAWLTARTTVYTITTQRLVMRFGVALPMTLNIPFKTVETAALKSRADGSGDIPLSLDADNRVSYTVTWPHVRPWRIAKPEPMLRGLPRAAAVAEILGQALARAAGQPEQQQVPQPQTGERWSGAEAEPLVPAVS